MSHKYKKCSYLNCNHNRSNYSGHFFRFPTSFELQESWMKNSGNVQLKNINNKLICDVHFRNSDFVNIRHRKLKKNVNPIPFDFEIGDADDIELKITNSVKNYSRESIDHQNNSEFLDSDDDIIFVNEEESSQQRNQSSKQLTAQYERNFKNSSSGDTVTPKTKLRTFSSSSSQLEIRSEGPLKSLSINSDYVSSLDLEIKEECVEPDRLIDVGTPLTATSIQCDGIESSSNEQLKWNSHFVSCESGDDKTNGTATEDYPTPYTTHPNNTPNKTLHFGYNGENKTTSEDLKLHSPISNESLCAISESSKKRKLEDEKDEFDALGINFAAKLRKMSTTQQILAESLMHKVIKFGLLNKLTELTDIIEMDASPDRQLNTKVAVQPTSASASQSRIESITSELQIKVEQIDYSNDAELLNEY